MRIPRASLLSVGLAGVVVASGCAGHDRERLHQPLEPNYADPADPLERPIEGLDALEPRGRIDGPIQAVPEANEGPPEAVDPDDRGDDQGPPRP